MDDMRELIEEFIDQLQKLVQPAPKPKRAIKWALSVGGLIVTSAIGAVIWDYRKAPRAVHDNQAE
jgi:hypothetical protein